MPWAVHGERVLTKLYKTVRAKFSAKLGKQTTKACARLAGGGVTVSVSNAVAWGGAPAH